ncbi:MAG: nucleotidyltransferase domain-containing protein [Magnetococcus sp. DMHC-6]
MTIQAKIIHAVLNQFPNVQAVYQFGSYGTTEVWPDSDVDIALLLLPLEAKQVGSLVMSPLHMILERLFYKDVDLINLRQVSTVLQREIIMAQRRIFCTDEYAADLFEMYVFSFYQKLNEERAAILEDGLRSGRFYNV